MIRFYFVQNHHLITQLQGISPPVLSLVKTKSPNFDHNQVSSHDLGKLLAQLKRLHGGDGGSISNFVHEVTHDDKSQAPQGINYLIGNRSIKGVRDLMREYRFSLTGLIIDFLKKHNPLPENFEAKQKLQLLVSCYQNCIDVCTSLDQKLSEKLQSWLNANPVTAPAV